jgi:hypothetical protein
VANPSITFQIGPSEPKIVDYLNIAVSERDRPDCDCIARFDHEWSQIGWKGKDGNVFSTAGPVRRVGEGAEGALYLVCALRLCHQIVSKCDIQVVVLDLKVENPGRSVPINIRCKLHPTDVIKVWRRQRHRSPPIIYGETNNNTVCLDVPMPHVLSVR